MNNSFLKFLFFMWRVSQKENIGFTIYRKGQRLERTNSKTNFKNLLIEKYFFFIFIKTISCCIKFFKPAIYRLYTSLCHLCFFTLEELNQIVYFIKFFSIVTSDTNNIFLPSCFFADNKILGFLRTSLYMLLCVSFFTSRVLQFLEVLDPDSKFTLIFHKMRNSLLLKHLYWFFQSMEKIRSCFSLAILSLIGRFIGDLGDPVSPSLCVVFYFCFVWAQNSPFCWWKCLWSPK